MIKKLKLKGQAIARRLTGISCPVAGISWIPPTDEKDKARRLLTFLEDRRALYQTYDMEAGPYVVKSILEIRERLTSDLGDVSKSSVLGESILAMRAACRGFLNKTQRTERHGYFMDALIISALGELRALFGVHIARLACAYDLELEEPLVSVLPPEPDDTCVKKSTKTSKMKSKTKSKTKKKSKAS
jgi:hypothetical protein